MIQHNSKKAKDLVSIIIKIVLWVFGGVIILMNYLNSKKSDFNYDTVSTIIAIISFVIPWLIGFFEKVLWKTKIFNKILFEKYWTPILAGRWEGKLTRDNIEHDFVLEIKQTFTSISCITYSKHSSSSSILAEVLYNEQLQTYQLIYYWDGKTRNVPQNIGDENRFGGFTILDINIVNRNAIRLEGEYFTNRQPNQTRGRLKFTSRQKELKNAFES